MKWEKDENGIVRKGLLSVEDMGPVEENNDGG